MEVTSIWLQRWTCLALSVTGGCRILIWVRLQFNTVQAEHRLPWPFLKEHLPWSLRWDWLRIGDFSLSCPQPLSLHPSSGASFDCPAPSGALSQGLHLVPQEALFTPYSPWMLPVFLYLIQIALRSNLDQDIHRQTAWDPRSIRTSQWELVIHKTSFCSEGRDALLELEVLAPGMPSIPQTFAPHSAMGHPYD